MHHFVELTVQDVMSHEVVTVTPQFTIAQLEVLFNKHGFNLFPVLEEGKLVGVVSEFDFLRTFIFTNLSPVPNYEHLMQKTIEDIFSRQLFTLRPDQPLTRVLEMMVESMFKSYPVVDAKQNLVGIISRRDLINALQPPARD